MTDAVTPTEPDSPPHILAWTRLRFGLLVAVAFGLMHFGSPVPVWIWIARAAILALVAILAFGLLERVPAQLPAWLPRWVLQVAAVLLVTPFACIFAQTSTAGITFRMMMGDPVQRAGFYGLLGPAIVIGPWLAFGAIVRRREALARQQAVRFQLERGELERQATEARLRLLQAQAQPHFLFNTLANVRALVRSGSPEAAPVLDSLIAYLRASVPRMNDAAATVGDEIALVRAYLDLMHMRMPDRLRFSVHADAAAEGLRCPPLTILTLVENAVRHGIDPAEEGGRIEVGVAVREGRCVVRVFDTGVGLEQSVDGAGTGLDSLRERLRLAFGDAQVRLSAVTPHGTSAEVEFPA